MVSAVAACGDRRSGPLALDPLPPLSAETWHVHVADGQALPALVAHGIVGGAYEQTFLDSARVVVNAEGRWELWSWMRQLRAGELQASLPRLDAGAWVITDTAYVFTSDVFGPRFSLSDVPGDTIRLDLRVETVPGVVRSALLRTPPATATVGSASP